MCSEERAKGERDWLMLLREQSPEFGYVEYRGKLLARMVNVSAFMKELKQAYSQWYNKKAKRKGPWWQDRFKSVLLEDDEKVLLTMAAYIDLNPCRRLPASGATRVSLFLEIQKLTSTLLDWEVR